MTTTTSSPSLLLTLMAILTLTIPPASAPPSAVTLAERQTISVDTDVELPSFTVPAITPGGTPNPNPCPVPCGYYAQLCCAADEQCITNSLNQAQCIPSGIIIVTPTTSTSTLQPPLRPTTDTCPPWTTSTYTITTTYSSITSYTVVYTRTELNVQTILGTASYSISPQPVECCAHPPPSPPQGSDCAVELGEVECGGICCAVGQYCGANGWCAALPNSSSDGGFWSYYTTTYVETDLQTVTSTVSSYVPGPQAPVRPTSSTIFTVTTSITTTTGG